MPLKIIIQSGFDCLINKMATNKLLLITLISPLLARNHGNLFVLKFNLSGSCLVEYRSFCSFQRDASCPYSLSSFEFSKINYFLFWFLKMLKNLKEKNVKNLKEII